MATQRQILANQQNAALSSGPKTEEGKAQSRRNSLKHGLAGHGVVLPEETLNIIQERMDEWRKEMRPDSPSQEWCFIQICAASVRADDCMHQKDVPC